MPAVRLYAAPGMGGPNGKKSIHDVIDTGNKKPVRTNNIHHCIGDEVVNNQAYYENLGRFIYNLYFKR